MVGVADEDDLRAFPGTGDDAFDLVRCHILGFVDDEVRLFQRAAANEIESFCLNELLSIVENTTLMGVPYPPVFKKAIDVLQTKIGRTDETTDKEDK